MLKHLQVFQTLHHAVPSPSFPSEKLSFNGKPVSKCQSVCLCLSVGLKQLCPKPKCWGQKYVRSCTCTASVYIYKYHVYKNCISNLVTSNISRLKPFEAQQCALSPYSQLLAFRKRTLAPRFLESKREHVWHLRLDPPVDPPPREPACDLLWSARHRTLGA